MDRIIERTKDSEFLNDLSSNAKVYSKKYKDSLDFKAAGKSNKVNLTLTGDMLGLLELEVDGNEVELGWDDELEQLKASNHIVGDTVPKRDFFGLTAADIKKIKAEFLPDLKEIKSSRGDKREDAILNLISRIEDDGED